MRSSTLIILAAAGLALAFSAPAPAAGSGSVAGLPAWGRVPTPSDGLQAVHVVSPSDVWAVGARGGRSLTEHFDGQAFHIVASANRPGRSNALDGIDGVAPDDVWAVGSSAFTQTLGSLTLAEHWDGTSWRIVPTPDVGTQATVDTLTAVATINAADAWAVGSATSYPGGVVALTLHWNGSAWAQVANDCGATALDGVAARSSNDVWAVGGAGTCHWNGSSWSPLAAAPDGMGSVDLRSVTIASPNDVWAVGLVSFSCGEGGVCSSGDIQHWNVSGWQQVTETAPVLYGVDALAPRDIYAVGGGFGPAVFHGNGTSWSEVPGGSPRGELFGIDASGPTDLWAAGDLGSGAAGSLVEQAPSATDGAVVGGTKVSGATVSWFGATSGSVQTDVRGDYEVGGVPAGDYQLTATFAGCTPASVSLTIVAGTTIKRDLHLTCH